MVLNENSSPETNHFMVASSLSRATPTPIHPNLPRSTLAASSAEIQDHITKQEATKCGSHNTLPSFLHLPEGRRQALLKVPKYPCLTKIPAGKHLLIQTHSKHGLLLLKIGNLGNIVKETF